MDSPMMIWLSSISITFINMQGLLEFIDYYYWMVMVVMQPSDLRPSPIIIKSFYYICLRTRRTGCSHWMSVSLAFNQVSISMKSYNTLVRPGTVLVNVSIWIGWLRLARRRIPNPTFFQLERKQDWFFLILIWYSVSFQQSKNIFPNLKLH